jgi:hypothetical protein
VDFLHFLHDFNTMEPSSPTISFDFVVLGEFSEIEGPVARITAIPKSVGLYTNAAPSPSSQHSRVLPKDSGGRNLGDVDVDAAAALSQFDMDAFVLRIMSVDVSHTYISFPRVALDSLYLLIHTNE